MKLVPTSQTFRDSTENYSVYFKNVTVKRLVKKILKRKEYGRIELTYPYPEIYGLKEYRYGNRKLLDKIPKKYLNKIVARCVANGGYSNMDYVIHIYNQD